MSWYHLVSFSPAPFGTVVCWSRGPELDADTFVTNAIGYAVLESRTGESVLLPVSAGQDIRHLTEVGLTEGEEHRCYFDPAAAHYLQQHHVFDGSYFELRGHLETVSMLRTVQTELTDLVEGLSA